MASSSSRMPGTLFIRKSLSFKLTPTGDMAVGLHRYLGESSALPENQQLFLFSGTPNRAAQPVFQTSGE